MRFSKRGLALTQRSGAVSMGGSPAFGVCARHGQNLTGESPEPAWYRNSDDLEYSLAKQEAIGDIEHTGNTDDIFATQPVCLFGILCLFPFSPTFSAI